jgi:uncharacterized membrane protein YeaQ/YmgE (transglycosylase-associated protein family)
MSVFWMFATGVIVGMLAKLFMPGKDPGVIIVTTLLGISGSVLAGILGRAAGWYGESGSAGLFVSALGAMLLLGMYRLFLRSHPFG